MRVLDLFCGAGGAGMGYHRAGFDVVGVDIKPQPHYPFKFYQGDALDFCRGHYAEFDAIHASPPCQAYSTATRYRDSHPDLYSEVREALEATGLPWVIENVPGAPYNSGIILCGSMFGIRIRRHRNFETSFAVLAPRCNHSGPRPYTVTGHLNANIQNTKHSLKPSRELAIRLMDMPWADHQEVVQAIPPAYTEYIGGFLLEHITPSQKGGALCAATGRSESPRQHREGDTR